MSIGSWIMSSWYQRIMLMVIISGAAWHAYSTYHLAPLRAALADAQASRKETAATKSDLAYMMAKLRECELERTPATFEARWGAIEEIYTKERNNFV